MQKRHAMTVAVAATFALLLTQCISQNLVLVGEDASLSWPDTRLQRAGEASLGLSGSLDVVGDLATNRVDPSGSPGPLDTPLLNLTLSALVPSGPVEISGPSVALQHSNAKLSFGPGNDTRLARTSASALSLDGNLLVTGSIASTVPFTLTYAGHVATRVWRSYLSEAATFSPPLTGMLCEAYGLPEGLQIDPSSGLIQGTPTGLPGDYSATITCFSGDRRHASTTLSWTFKIISTDPALWVDASKAASLTLVGAALDRWKDLSGNARDLIAVTRPVMNYRWINGINVPAFSSGAFMATGNGVLRVDNFTTCVVVRFSNSPGCGVTDVMSITDLSSSDSNAFVAKRLVSQKRWRFRGTSSAGVTDAYTNTADKLQDSTDVVCLQYDNTTMRGSINGAWGSSMSHSGMNSTRMYAVLGSRLANSFATGDGQCNNFAVAEWLYYEAALNDLDMGRVQRYLYAKWF